VNDVTVFVHLKPPIGHGQLLAGNVLVFRSSLPDFGFRVRDAFGARKAKKKSAAGGLISPIIRWLHFGDHQLAPFRRSQSGSISAITEWLYITDQ